MTAGKAVPVRILVLPSWYPSLTNPIDGIFVADQVRTLATAHRVAVLVPEVASVYGLWNPGRRQSTTVEEADGLLTIRAFAQSWVPRSLRASYRTRLRAAESSFRSIIRMWGRPDVIHAHVVLPGGWIAVQLGRRHGIPVVLTEHSSPLTIHLKTAWMRSRVRSTLQRCAALIAVSATLAAALREHAGGRSIRVVGNVLPPELTELELSPEGCRAVSGEACIAFVGGLRAQKGVEFLLDAFAAVIATGVDARLALAGEGPLRDELMQRSRELGIADRCRFLGSLSRTEVYELLQRSDLLVVSSLHETFCIAAAEAMACGKPVVTTRCGGPEEFVTPDSGTVVEPGNAAALASGIREVIARRRGFDPVGIRARILHAFGPETFLSRMSTVYNQALSMSPGSGSQRQFHRERVATGDAKSP